MAVAVIRRVGHEDRLSSVGHVEELRARLIVCAIAIAAASGLCFWQNHLILRLINRPLAQQTQTQAREGHGPLGASYLVQLDARELARQLRALTNALQQPGSGLSRPARSTLAGISPELARDAARLARAPGEDRPVTLGIGEPFTATLGVSLICGLILALPIVLYVLYGFLLPALDPAHQRAARPLVCAVPVLFALGVAFGWLVVLPAAVRFFQNFNSGQFDVLVQASQYYKFAAVTLLATGVVFQVPVAILAATRAGIVSPRQLRRQRRWALLACAAVAAFIPGDLTTMMLETIPLYLLFEISVFIAAILDRHRAARPAPAG